MKALGTTVSTASRRLRTLGIGGLAGAVAAATVLLLGCSESGPARLAGSRGCPAGRSGAPKDRVLGALACAAASSWTASVTTGERTLVLTVNPPDRSMSTETQAGSNGPEPVRVVRIGTDDWESHAGGRWTHFHAEDTANPLELLTLRVRGASTISRAGATFTIGAAQSNDSRLGGITPLRVTLADDGTLRSLSGTDVNEGGASEPIHIEFSRFGSTPRITAPAAAQVDEEPPSDTPPPRPSAPAPRGSYCGRRPPTPTSTPCGT